MVMDLPKQQLRGLVLLGRFLLVIFITVFAVSLRLLLFPRLSLLIDYLLPVLFDYLLPFAPFAPFVLLATKVEQILHNIFE